MHNMKTLIVVLLFAFACICTSYSFNSALKVNRIGLKLHAITGTVPARRYSHFAGTILQAQPKDGDDSTEKYGVDVGLVNEMTTGDGGEQKAKPKDLLAKYGIAYLLTSISFAIVSYALCYVLVSNGVDVGAVLERIGIKSTAVASNAGTVAIAYAVHKAASPIRFPPTVAMTPVVAQWIGRKSSRADEPVIKESKAIRDNTLDSK